jgi:hypothetical protein
VLDRNGLQDESAQLEVRQAGSSGILPDELHDCESLRTEVVVLTADLNQDETKEERKWFVEVFVGAWLCVMVVEFELENGQSHQNLVCLGNGHMIWT